MSELQRKLRREVRDAFNTVPSLLGGSKQGKRIKPDIVSRAKTANAVLDFAEASEGFGGPRHEGSLTVGTAIRPR